MTQHIFPYGIRFQEDGRIEVFPALEISLLGPKGDGLRLLLHIDSGATTSILPESDAENLKISKKNGKKMLVRGITGSPLTGYRQLVRIQLGTITLKIPVIFVAENAIPRILGREGVFSKFGILFDEAKRRTAFLNDRTRINSFLQ